MGLVVLVFFLMLTLFGGGGGDQKVVTVTKMLEFEWIAARNGFGVINIIQQQEEDSETRMSLPA